MSTCERCNKTIINLFGSGRFCSRSCANSRIQSQEVRQKISHSVKKNPGGWAKKSYLRKNSTSMKYREEYRRNPKSCSVCKKVLSYEKKRRSTCSKECLSKANAKQGGLKENSVKSYVHGIYQGIRYDSSWELAYIKYNLFHSIPFERNKDSFEYIDSKGKKRRYYPDFKEGEEYVEIKGFINSEVKHKIECFPKNKRLRIIGYIEIQKYLQFINVSAEHWLELKCL